MKGGHDGAEGVLLASVVKPPTSGLQEGPQEISVASLRQSAGAGGWWGKGGDGGNGDSGVSVCWTMSGEQPGVCLLGLVCNRFFFPSNIQFLEDFFLLRVLYFIGYVILFCALKCDFFHPFNSMHVRASMLCHCAFLHYIMRLK